MKSSLVRGMAWIAIEVVKSSHDNSALHCMEGMFVKYFKHILIWIF